MSVGNLPSPARVVDGLSLHYSGDIAIIVMDRGENRLNIEFFEALLTLLDEVEKNDACKGLITTGVGKFYGNGLDVDWMALQSDETLARFFYLLSSCMKRILLLPLPTLAALNGHCYAGGALIAFAHDFRTMRDDRGWLCFNEVFINRRFSQTNYKLFRAKIGGGRTSTDAVLFGRRFTAKEALESNLVHATPSQTLLIPESIRLLKGYSGKSGYPRQSLANLKADMFQEIVESFDEDMRRLMPSKL